MADVVESSGSFRAYVADLASVLGHADRVRPFEDYCVGLLSAEGRKSVEPLAAVTAPERTAAQHQSLLQHSRRVFCAGRKMSIV
jgi:SRSO17 transposase